MPIASSLTVRVNARGRPMRIARVVASILVLWPSLTWADESVGIGNVGAVAGQRNVVVPILATTNQSLTLLAMDVTFDPSLCAALENQRIRRAGRTLVELQEGGERCPAEGRVSIVGFDLAGQPGVPIGSGLVAEWVFDVKASAGGGTFPLGLALDRARNGPVEVAFATTGGTLSIARTGATPTSTSTGGPTPSTGRTPTAATPARTPTTTGVPSGATPRPPTPVATPCVGNDLDGDGIADACDGDDARLELRSVAMRRNTAHGRPNGHVRIRGYVDLAAAGDTFDVESGLLVHVTDGVLLQQTFWWEPSECHALRSGRIRCRSVAQRWRATFQPVGTNPHATRLRFRMVADLLDVGEPSAPLQVQLTHSPPISIEGINRLGTLTRCRTTTSGMLCREDRHAGDQ